MKKGFLLSRLGILAFLIPLASCNFNAGGSREKYVKVDTFTDKDGRKFNYTYEKNGEKLSLIFSRTGNNVKGDLVYDFKEKDDNKGTIIGTMKDSILIADYTFQSEGSTSVRQVAFKFENNTLLEGYGEVEEKGGKVIFKDVNQLKFTKPF